MKISALVVDDNPADRLWTKMMLEKSKRYSEIIFAKDAMEALSLFEEPDKSKEKWADAFPPDLVLLDINMPRIDGFEFLSRLEKLQTGHFATLRVWMWVDAADIRTQKKAMSQGPVIGTLSKPLSVETASDLADRVSADIVERDMLQ